MWRFLDLNMVIQNHSFFKDSLCLSLSILNLKKKDYKEL